MGNLGLNSELSKVEVLALGAWPMGGEDTWVSACGLSIKLDG